jgi:hypothetical protein
MAPAPTIALLQHENEVGRCELWKRWAMKVVRQALAGRGLE